MSVAGLELWVPIYHHDCGHIALEVDPQTVMYRGKIESRNLRKPNRNPIPYRSRVECFSCGAPIRLTGLSSQLVREGKAWVKTASRGTRCD